MTSRSLIHSISLAVLLVALCSYGATPATEGLRLATFDVDATPPVGSMLAYDPVVRVDELTLRCRGIVLLGAGEPIVLCAVDWIGIANESQDAFREALAKAAGTTPQRVVVHTVHQHDAPGCDFTAEELLKKAGVKDLGRVESTFTRKVLARAAEAIQAAVTEAKPVTHCGWGRSRSQGSGVKTGAFRDPMAAFAPRATPRAKTRRCARSRRASLIHACHC